jgi:hypothetical protein
MICSDRLLTVLSREYRVNFRLQKRDLALELVPVLEAEADEDVA